MPARKEPALSLDGWRARNPKHLREIYSDLRPESNDPGTGRTFAGQALTLEQAGGVFERWVLEAFRLSGQTGHYSFEVSMSGSGTTREQIDGMVLDGWQGFLIESKFWTGKVDFGPIALFHTIVDTRPIGTLGLFFSAFGYTYPAQESADRLRPMRVLLFDHVDLTWALAKEPFKGSMAEMVRRKWVLAVQYGNASLSASRPIELFN
jgi:hypothetical protein